MLMKYGFSLSSKDRHHKNEYAVNIRLHIRRGCSWFLTGGMVNDKSCIGILSSLNGIENKVQSSICVRQKSKNGRSSMHHLEQTNGMKIISKSNKDWKFKRIQMRFHMLKLKP